MSTPGVPDIIGVYKGIPLFLEIKTKKGVLSEYQKIMIRCLNDAGALAGVLRSAESAQLLISGLKNGTDISELRKQIQD